MVGKRNLRKDQYAEYNLRVLNVVAHYAYHQEDPKEGLGFLKSEKDAQVNLVGFIYAARYCYDIFFYKDQFCVNELSLNEAQGFTKEILEAFKEPYLKAKKEIEYHEKM